MILKEATIGGTYYPDYLESENAKPESERVAFVYKALTNREKIDLLDQVKGIGVEPNTVPLLMKAVTSVRNIVTEDGTELDTIPKLLAYNDEGHQVDYLLCVASREIWKRQGMSEVLSKNFDALSTSGKKDILKDPPASS